MPGFEKRSVLGEKAVIGEPNRRVDDLLGVRMDLTWFILVVGANIALLSVVVRQLSKRTSAR
ncbi:MAG: hypothetical protein AUF65_01045 [Chloroflexi bacterium 13_1_20CM_50_12]|nr:MAG: hypothetical protein AUF65_01045 [Chloroflexi bacterium 13_1_20CM_50_12]